MVDSEFGKGLVICLVKFAEHRERFQHIKAFYEDMGKKVPSLLSISDAVEMHFNAASDHLYEIEIPASYEGTELGNKIKELQKLSLEIGHGFSGKKWTEDFVNKAHDLCREIALLIDKELGLKPELGNW